MGDLQKIWGRRYDSLEFSEKKQKTQIFSLQEICFVWCEQQEVVC